MNAKQTKSIENALYHALKSNGLLRSEVTEQEEGTTESLLPSEFSNPDNFIKKETKVIPLKPKSRFTKRPQLAKVAMKRKKTRKKK